MRSFRELPMKRARPFLMNELTRLVSRAECHRGACKQQSCLNAVLHVGGICF